MRQYAQRRTAALLRTLAARLNAAAEAGDAGAIHDLRVAIRRLSRGLRVFAPFYADRSWKRVRGELRALMQLAGAVRDRDIALECLAKAGVDATAGIVARLQAERNAASADLLADIRRWKAEGVSRRWRAQLEVPLDPKERGAPLASARRTLPGLAAEYFAEVRAILADHPRPRDLHRARLATKRYRYTLELFRGCYGTGLETRIATLRKVQQLLGDVNDCVASWDLLSGAMEKSPERKKVRRFLKERADRHAAEFREEWEERFDGQGREAWWKNYLKNIRKSA